MIDELKKSNYQCKQFMNTYFQTQLKGNDGKETLTSVQKLKIEIEEKKNEIKKRIQNEMDGYRNKIHEMKEHTSSMKEQLLYIQRIYKKEEEAREGEEIQKKINHNEENVFMNNKSRKDEKQKEWNDLNRERFSDSEEEDTNKNKLEDNESFEDLLKKSIETKMKLEQIRKGLLFLKQFPLLKKEIEELFTTTKNIKLDVEEKMKNALVLYNHLLYINENEEIILHFKEYADIEIILYTQSYFTDFFNLLHDILHLYLFEGNHVNIFKLLKVYIVLFKTYWKHMNGTIGSKELIGSEIIKKIIHLCTTHFSKTFVKFVQSENDQILYNCIIQYYEFFSTYIGENEETIERIMFAICYLNDYEEIGNEINDCNRIENSFETFRNKGDKIKEENENDIMTIIPRYESIINEHIILLFKESICVICDHLAKNKIVKSMEETNKKGKGTANGKTNQSINKNKNFIMKIMDALKISVGILSNCTFFISRKKLLEPILKEADFINKKIIEEYLILITKGITLNNEELENMNMKLSNVDRNNLMRENKLLHFFTEILNDMKNTVQKKYNEIHTNDVFNTHFFRFVIYFFFISTHDTEFLFLFINLYNFLYEIIYNIKEEIKKIKNEIDKEQINKAKFNESLNLKDDVAISSNKIIEYVKEIMQTFIKLLAIFNDIINEYESFCSFIVEQTYKSLKNDNIWNTISKQIVQKEKYPTEIEPHILHIHNHFFNEEMQDIHNNSTIKEKMDSTSGINQVKRETNKQIFKSSLSKVYEIQNSILNNIIYFALVPLYEYLNKYISKMKSLQEKDCTKEPLDPEQNICLIVHIIFKYIEIFYENKNEMIIQQLFAHLIDKYTHHIKNISGLNKHMALQIHADVQYLINVCKKFKITNYKQFLILFHAINYQLLKIKENNTQPMKPEDTYMQIENYFKEYEKEFHELSFNITSEDIASVTSFVNQSMSYPKNETA